MSEPISSKLVDMHEAVREIAMRNAEHVERQLQNYLDAGFTLQELDLIRGRVHKTEDGKLVFELDTVIVKEYPPTPEPKREEFTCFSCPYVESCPYAYDLYNLNGDCLASK